ncbi:MAG: VCBS repeat-containing protein [Acidobacteria bacterium]|nr:VCBS repeat-containing protein [Acidobacteriota bacterium]MBI3426355.1 VCBS repeat-containing protein [Acidobacteriota bacterium]
MFKIIATMFWLGWLGLAPVRMQAPLFSPAPGSPVEVGEGSGRLVLADVNGDGRQDLLTCHLLQQFVAVHLGDGTGRFVAAAGSPLKLSYQPGDLQTTDLNGDGFADLLITHSEQDSVDVFFGDGKGRFTLAPGAPFKLSGSTEYFTRRLHLVDLNEDGKLDVVTANLRQYSMASLLGNGRGQFTPGPAIKLPVSAGSPPRTDGDLFADLDGDRHLDLVIASGDRGEFAPVPGQVKIFRGDGKGGFKESAATGLTIPAAPFYVKLADVNGDQRLDIITSHPAGQLNVLLNQGAAFAPAPGSPYAVNATPYGLAVADVNGDQRMDLIVATVADVTVLLGRATGFAPAPGSPFRAGPGSYHLTLGDVNQDGKRDIAASSFEGKAVTLLLGR